VRVRGRPGCRASPACAMRGAKGGRAEPALNPSFTCWSQAERLTVIRATDRYRMAETRHPRLRAETQRPPKSRAGIAGAPSLTLRARRSLYQVLSPGMGCE
jgi:hypothetical protein